ncbi:uncharacterized protein LOC133889361 [Phragmites australis]|uniref:uncharacterized protein LOC133889361 n=1 Tax=Phragmites australis TaxID=29695 RepID=UPI002D79FD13|nr:uncharacterized protein LOC133889361 [Phragmites australis]
MYDQRILQVKRFSQYPKPFDKFVRWVPLPPNPPKLTDKEKWQLKSIRVADPPLCNYGKRSVLCEPSGGSPYFRCEGMTRRHGVTCGFRDPLYGPDGQWKDEEKDEMKEKRVIEPCAPRKCPCDVNANHGIVPSELGVGYYCGHVIGNDMRTWKCSWEEYLDKGAVDHEIAWRSKRPPNVLSSYLENRKKETRDYYRALYPPMRSTTMAGKDVSATEVEIETMKTLVGNLPMVIPDDDDDEVLYDGLDD